MGLVKYLMLLMVMFLLNVTDCMGMHMQGTYGSPQDYSGNERLHLMPNSSNYGSHVEYQNAIAAMDEENRSRSFDIPVSSSSVSQASFSSSVTLRGNECDCCINLCSLMLEAPVGDDTDCNDIVGSSCKCLCYTAAGATLVWIMVELIGNYA